jgi:hypothetical protein
MPMLDRAARQHADAVRFVGIDTQDDPNRARSFAAELGVSYQLVRDRRDRERGDERICLIAASGVAADAATTRDRAPLGGEMTSSPSARCQRPRRAGNRAAGSGDR